MHTYSLDTNKLTKNIEKQLRHDYLKRFITKPIINQDKVFLFQQLYARLDIPWIQKEKLITTILLIDIALNTHDRIPSCRKDAVMDETELQLSVLAGDYYSAQYYFILSYLEDIHMTRLLAKTIKQMSENKFRLFYHDTASINDYIQLMKETESLFYIDIASDLKEKALIPIVQEYFLMDKLLLEKESINKDEFSALFNYIKAENPLIDQASVDAIIDKAIADCIQQIEHLLIELPYHYSDIKTFVSNKLYLHGQLNRSIVEEG